MLLQQHKQLQASVLRASGRQARGALVVRLAEQPPNPRVKNSGRTFSEEGQVSTQKQEGPLYADAQPKKKEDNMSMEMKKRLRDEYVGLGGTPNKAMGSNYFLWIIVIISALAVASKLNGAF